VQTRNKNEKQKYHTVIQFAKFNENIAKTDKIYIFTHIYMTVYPPSLVHL